MNLRDWCSVCRIVTPQQVEQALMPARNIQRCGICGGRSFDPAGGAQ